MSSESLRHSPGLSPISHRAASPHFDEDDADMLALIGEISKTVLTPDATERRALSRQEGATTKLIGVHTSGYRSAPPIAGKRGAPSGTPAGGGADGGAASAPATLGADEEVEPRTPPLPQRRYFSTAQVKGGHRPRSVKFSPHVEVMTAGAKRRPVPIIQEGAAAHSGIVRPKADRTPPRPKRRELTAPQTPPPRAGEVEAKDLPSVAPKKSVRHRLLQEDREADALPKPPSVIRSRVLRERARRKVGIGPRKLEREERATTAIADSILEGIPQLDLPPPLIERPCPAELLTEATAPQREVPPLAVSAAKVGIPVLSPRAKQQVSRHYHLKVRPHFSHRAQLEERRSAKKAALIRDRRTGHPLI